MYVKGKDGGDVESVKVFSCGVSVDGCAIESYVTLS